jgi:hypothetical protein
MTEFFFELISGHIIFYFSFPVQILEGKYPSLPRGSGWYVIVPYGI